MSDKLIEDLCDAIIVVALSFIGFMAVVAA